MKPKKPKKSSKKVLPEGGSEALADALASIERNYGTGSIMRMGQKTQTDITGYGFRWVRRI